jgi:hypothetical protein
MALLEARDSIHFTELQLKSPSLKELSNNNDTNQVEINESTKIREEIEEVVSLVINRPVEEKNLNGNQEIKKDVCSNNDNKNQEIKKDASSNNDNKNNDNKNNDNKNQEIKKDASSNNDNKNNDWRLSTNWEAAVAQHLNQLQPESSNIESDINNSSKINSKKENTFENILNDINSLLQ